MSAATSADQPDLRFVLPLGSETRWSDLLAALVATDPEPLTGLLGLAADQIEVHREVAIDSANRPDIVLSIDGRRTAVIEVKVLAGLGSHQLGRYEAAEPNADRYILVYPGLLPIDLDSGSRWHGMTWETVLEAFVGSNHPWVAVTASAWLQHLADALPVMTPETVWDALVPGEDFVLALRTRMSWLHRNIQRIDTLSYDLVPSAAGVSWVLRMYAPTGRDGYRVLTEVEENLPVRDYPKTAGPDRFKPRGLSAKVMLARSGERTSEGFDWEHLHLLWQHMRAHRADWVTNAAKARATHDREGHARIVAAGAPRYLGVGYGNAQARISGDTMFGARIQYSPSATLRQLQDEIAQVAALTSKLATVTHPVPAG